MNRRQHITPETRPTNASAQWVETYNALQDRINSFIDASATVPQELLNGSHIMVLSTMLPQRQCATVQVSTGKHCPEFPAHMVEIDGEAVYLCEKCHKNHKGE